MLVLSVLVPAGEVLAREAPAVPLLNPHLDESLVLTSCVACHRGHGESGSPMLPGPQVEVCLSCHDDSPGVDQQVRAGVLPPGSNPALLGDILRKGFVHPVDSQAYSEHDSGTTCTSCHSAHRSVVGRDVRPGFAKASPKSSNRFEFELCLDCHGGQGPAYPGERNEVGQLIWSSNPSYHPVDAPSAGRSPSVVDELSGRQINCTSCHGSDDLTGPRGPHGSNIRFILKRNYNTVDGAENAEAYWLCYGCHDREKVLSADSPFPLHDLHVVKARAACANCHSAHGSHLNRSLIHIGEEYVLGGVLRSSSERVGFVSDFSGSGACYLSCHGVDHDPLVYGLGSTLLDPLRMPGDP